MTPNPDSRYVSPGFDTSAIREFSSMWMAPVEPATPPEGPPQKLSPRLSIPRLSPTWRLRPDSRFSPRSSPRQSSPRQSSPRQSSPRSSPRQSSPSPESRVSSPESRVPSLESRLSGGASSQTEQSHSTFSTRRVSSLSRQPRVQISITHATSRYFYNT